MAYLVAIHLLSAVVWVGGMFFALMVLRPAVGPWLCCKLDVGVSQIRTTTVLSSCFCVGQTVL